MITYQHFTLQLHKSPFLFIPSFSPLYRTYMLRRASQLTNQITTTTTMSSSTRKTPDIHLYTAQTPNGIKISITLEELG